MMWRLWLKQKREKYKILISLRLPLELNATSKTRYENSLLILDMREFSSSDKQL